MTANRFDTILDTIGRTPIVRIRKLAPSHVELYAKIEAFNPMGSIKDRAALAIIEDAERRGALRPGQTVVEASSGNTGIALAMVCAQKGYPLVVVMAESFSVERRKLMRFLGAKVVLTPASQRGSGMLAKAVELAETHGWFLCRQFENEANADAHARTTALEILEAFEGVPLHAWVTGTGTGGTLKGVARVLRERSPETERIVCEPDNSPLLGGAVPPPDAAATGGHPLFRPHVMQGWTPDFVPKLAGDAVRMGLVDRVVPVTGADALRCARELAQREGILVGITSGATLAGALEVCRTAPRGARVLCMLPDTGERYLSTPLFADVETDMTEDEVAISRSTPGYRFDVPAPAPAPAPAAVQPRPVDPDAVAYIERVLRDRSEPVVMFALEWCEFCGSVRRAFREYAIRHRSVDLDSAELRNDDRGGAIRRALSARTSMTTIPQVFVGGELVGGATEVLEAWRDGRLQRLLAANGVSYDDSRRTDPLRFLPSWVHPR